MNVIQFDRRATHRVISDVSAFDRILDVQADAMEAMTLLHNAYFQAMPTGDEALLRTMRRVGGKVIHILNTAREGAALLEDSVTVDPYLAIQYAHTSGPDAA